MPIVELKINHIGCHSENVGWMVITLVG